ncbi:MAG: thiamine pyrophosphate-dependent enzyme, partial [Actinomycetota bacterium]
DLVIAVGVDPVEHPPANWNRADLDVIHVAEWPARLGVDYLPRVEVVGNLRDALEQLGSRVSDDVPRRDRAVVAARRDQQRAALDHEPTRLEAGADSGLAPIDVVEAVADDVDPDGIVALDNGAYKLWFARHHPTRRRHGLLLDNALATMGAGLAIGTEAARLERETPVVAVVGDGGFLMNVGDLETAVRHDCRNLTAVVLRDDAYGFIVDHQKERGRAETAVRLGNPDVVRLAESFGCRSLRATSRRELVEALDVCRRHAGVSVVDVPLDARHHELLR